MIASRRPHPILVPDARTRAHPVRASVRTPVEAESEEGVIGDEKLTRGGSMKLTHPTEWFLHAEWTAVARQSDPNARDNQRAGTVSMIVN
jgi:hypothetical protein